MPPAKLNISCGLDDSYAKYGLRHFLKKYLPHSILGDNKKDADIFFGYSQSDRYNAKLQVIVDRNATDEKSCLKIEGQSIPLFKRPLSTNGEITLGTIESDNEEYTCLSITGNKILAGFDIFEEIGRTMAGEYDNYFLEKNTSGEELRATPTVDMLEDCLFKAMKQVAASLENEPHFLWPDGHKFAMVLTHDVDRIYKTYQYLPSILNSLTKADFSELGYHINNLLFKHGQHNPYWRFEDIFKMENGLGVKSSYYFLNERGKHNPFSLKSWILYRGVYNIESVPVAELIRQLAERGFEIGVHGSYNSYNDLELLKSEKHTLESITGLEIRGVRQHYLNYEPGVTPGIHDKVGFNYDSSIGFKPESGAGFRRGTCFPFEVLLPDFSVSPVLEIPLIIMDGSLDSVTTSDECNKLMDQVEKYNGVLTILWHTNRFNRREYPGMADLYKHLILKAKEKGAWIARADEVYDWITKSDKKKQLLRPD